MKQRLYTGLICLLLASAPTAAQPTGVLNAGFLCLDGVYNSELMAPFDILQHSVYRDSLNYIRCFIVTPDGQQFTSSEGIRILPDYSLQNCPTVDILIIPSTENSMGADLRNHDYMQAVKTLAKQADYVMTLCDGAFPAAEAGLLKGRTATTFPGDRDELRDNYPQVKVLYDVNFVVDGKMITSVGGALSYEPALYLLEHLYSAENARRTAQGMVLDWRLEEVPHVVVQK